MSRSRSSRPEISSSPAAIRRPTAGSAEVSISDTNFLGTGDIAKASVTYGQYARGFDVAFTDPWFLGQHVGVGVELFGQQTFANSNQAFNTSYYGGQVECLARRSPTTSA